MPSERIQLLIDVVTGNAKSSLNQLKSDLQNADTAFGKVKVAGSALGGFLKQNLAFGAAAAGTALVGFGVDAAKAFTDAGRAAGLMRDQTGLAAEEASRFAEVGADLGIPAETLAAAINRMNRAAASTPEAFTAIGASLKTASDGSLDVQETFLETIDAINRIPDAAARADAAQRIFGRGWQQIAELISTGADGVRASLEGVSDAQVFSDEEIAKAREMHARLEDLQDQFLALQLAAGEFVVDFVAGVEKISGAIGETVRQAKRLATFQDLRQELFGTSEVIGTAAENLGNFTRQVGEAQGPVARTGDELEAMAQAYRDAGIAAQVVNGVLVVGAEDLRRVADATTDAGDAASDFEGRVQDLASAQQYVKDQIAAAREELTEWRIAALEAAGGVHDVELAQLRLADSLSDLQQKTEDYNTAVEDGTFEGREQADALRDIRGSQLGAAQAALDAATAFADQSGAAEGSRRHTNALHEELRRLADENPAIRDEIQKYIDKISQIREKARTEVGIDGRQKAEDDAKAVKDAVDAIPNPKTSRIDLATADATAAANNFEARLNAIEDETVFINVVERVAGRLPSPGNIGGGGFTAAPGNELGGFSAPTGGYAGLAAAGMRTGLPPRVARLRREARELAAESRELREQAAALRERAKATEDAERKEELFDEAQEKSEQSADKWEKAVDKARKSAELHQAAIQRQADALHRQAEAMARSAEATSEQADSVSSAIEAGFALRDAQRAALEARQALNFSAVPGERLTAAQQAEAFDDAAEAALRLAQARAELRREQVEAGGGTLTEVQSTMATIAGLRSQLRGAPPALQALLRQMINQLERQADIQREEAQQRRQAADLERDARRREREAERAGNVRPTTILNVNVTAPFGSNPDQFGKAVADGLGRHIRNNGPGPLRRLLGIT